MHIKEDKYSVVGKVATGNYSKVPWISIYDENITKETKDGYYLVYLFHPEGRHILIFESRMVKDKCFRGIKMLQNKEH